MFRCNVPFDKASRLQWLDLPFDVNEYKARISRLREEIAQAGLDAVLVFGTPADLGSIRYLTNFEPTLGVAVLVVLADGGEGLTLVTDSIMHGEPMHSGIWATWIEDVRPAYMRATVAGQESVATVLGRVLAEKGLAAQPARLGLVGVESLSEQTAAQIRAAIPQLQFTSATPILLKLRSYKSQTELVVMRKAAEIASRAITAIAAALAPGVTETQLAGEAYRAMMAAGAEGPSFPLSLVSGPRSSLKHAYPSDKPVRQGELLFVDLGASFKGYCSDVSRTMSVGNAPRGRERELLECAVELQDRVFQAVKPGVPVKALQEAAESFLAGTGFEKWFYPSGMGHGLGCSLVELPFLQLGSEFRLEAGMTFALEPMLVVHGLGTACIEDVVLVTADGAARLSDCPRRFW